MSEATGQEQAAQAPSEAPQQANLYTRNPIQVEARQFFRYNGAQLADWCGGTFVYRRDPFSHEPFIRLSVREGEFGVEEGFWIIKQPDSMFTTLSDVDFHQFYSPVYPSPTEGGSSD